MSKPTGFGSGKRVSERLEIVSYNGAGLLALGFLMQSIAIGYLLTKQTSGSLSQTASQSLKGQTSCVQPQFNVGTTGNVYITHPRGNSE